MKKTFSVSLKKIIDNLNIGVVYCAADLNDIQIASADVNRPGLLLAGFSEYFDPTRIQVCGKVEMSFLEKMDIEERQAHTKILFQSKPVAVIITRNLDILEEMIAYAKEYNVPLLQSSENTSTLMSALISLLAVELAPRITRHGVFVEVYGEGLLLLGESGVGKSETAIELVKRGHRLIADDAVELRKVSGRTIVGNAPENIRHFIELRGIGIINVARVFGVGAVKLSEKVDMVIELEQWNKEKNYSRTGLENCVVDLMGIDLPLSVIPVRPGRNLAVILETAALNNRQKKLGYNAAEELMEKLGLENDIR